MALLKQILVALAVSVVVVLAALAFQPEKDFGALSGPNVIFPTNFLAPVSTEELTQGGGFTTISTTSATYTLTQSELESGNVLEIADTAGSAALALSLPATSSWTTLLPDAGDSRQWVVWNAHSAAATTTTITAGTGIDLQGDTANDDVINGGVFGLLECTRLDTTDIVCIVSEKVAAD